jgi:hypothetical protein
MDTCNNKKRNFIGLIVIGIILIVIYIIFKNNSVDNFIVFLDEKIIPKSCPDYLVTNGKNYFLLNSRMIIDGVKNPMKFDTKNSAVEYLKINNCVVDIPFVDVVMRKKTEDVTVSLDRKCNKKISPNLFNLDICNTYGSDYDTTSGNYISKINKITNDKKLYSNYDQEECMISEAIENNPELDDTNFKKQFSQYFDRMNNQIPEEYLYITGN